MSIIGRRWGQIPLCWILSKMGIEFRFSRNNMSAMTCGGKIETNFGFTACESLYLQRQNKIR